VEKSLKKIIGHMQLFYTVLFGDQTNLTEKIRGIFSVGNQRNSVGFVGIIFRPPQVFSQLCQFSSNFDVSYHFGIRRQNQ
jgi:hypothetical protein